MKNKDIPAGGGISQAGFPEKRSRFTSFDGGVIAEGLLQQPDRYRFWSPGSPANGPVISRGAGLSYSAASFSDGGRSIEHKYFNRILNFDSREHIVEVEAGINLFALYAFLSKRGLYLPIQPGHGRITVGGCVATDVHGKNHAKDGTFINQIVELVLFHPDHGIVGVSPETEPDLFRLTCGGYGLTGHILRVKLRAGLIPSNFLKFQAIPVNDVFSGIDQLVQKAVDADLAYSWHDFSLKGSHFGRGYVYLAEFESKNKHDITLEHPQDDQPPFLSADGRVVWRLPLLNRWTTRLLNIAYRIKQEAQGRIRCESLRDVLFPIHKTQFYFKLFGNRGFHEYQVVIPKYHIHDYIDGVRHYLSSHPIAVTLASAKLFGGRRELLRFTGEGICFALNIPRTSESPRFLDYLDGLVIALDGIPNIIKDSRLPRSVIEACYPETQKFRDLLKAFDSSRRFQSELSERLGL